MPKDIIDLLSAFLPNRRGDVARLRAALVREDWSELQKLSERLFALGNPYGFRQITTFGRMMRDACADRNKALFSRLIEGYETYLAEVTVVEVEAPVTRRELSSTSRSVLLGEPGRTDGARRRRRRASAPAAARTR